MGATVSYGRYWPFSGVAENWDLPLGTVRKYSQLPCSGFRMPWIAASPGLEIGPAGSPAFRYVLYGPGVWVCLIVALTAYLPSPYSTVLSNCRCMPILRRLLMTSAIFG